MRTGHISMPGAEAQKEKPHLNLHTVSNAIQCPYWLQCVGLCLPIRLTYVGIAILHLPILFSGTSLNKYIACIFFK